MASNNNGTKRTHVSPGIYYTETDLTYASKSLGITTLGVVGETLKGPAFQPIAIEDWASFQTYFGGTSTEKFKGSQYPKYELPYIAKEYLKQSRQLQVCRVLGLSGVNAGEAWIISAYKQNPSDTDELKYTSDKPLVIAVLRSRGEHKKAAFKSKANPDEGICDDVYEYDKLLYYAKTVKIKPSASLSLNNDCTPGYSATKGVLTINSNNYGTFTLEVVTYEGETKNYAVSFNPNEKNYILNVLGTNPEVGESEIYVEEFYDVALQQLVERGLIDTLGSERALESYKVAKIIPDFEEVTDILTEDESMLKRKDVGRRFLYSADLSVNEEGGAALKVHTSADKGITWVEADGQAGHIYTVKAYTLSDGTRTYYYGEYTNSAEILTEKKDADVVDDIFRNTVYNTGDGLYYVMEDGDVKPVTLDLNNYRESYRYASTPWIVSEMKGSANHVELTKLFRFHTISDGASANTEFKVSIENIDPTYGTFDVLVRDFYDTDASPSVLEKFKSCDLIPGSSNYIAYKIGSTDETYETKSKYITVEVNETDKTKVSIPAGFLGYPVRDYEGRSILTASKKFEKPYFQYNCNVDSDIRITKQYFGISDITGIDEDILKYKGVEAYNGLPSGMSPCFHLDSRIFEGQPDSDGVVSYSGIDQTVSVDDVKGYQWVTVGKGNTVGEYDEEPRLGDETTMLNTIYEDKRYRKFTVVFYGGFDGWDYYRTYRSNTDDFKYQKYRGSINTVSGEGSNFSVIREPEKYNFDRSDKVITSDYYAYLSAIREFANPKTIDINVLATPGIDYVNNNLLVGETIEMVEEERADSVYVVTTPDKPLGAGDGVTEMYTPSEAVDNLDDSEIDSNYTCTYYPWIKYEDTTNNQYIYLPATKDIVRNFALTDNTTYPWFAAAGWNRGDINAVKPKKSLKLSEQDELYAGRINFVNSFAQEGNKLWGDKNLQIADSQLNRISKRRLLIRIRKLISIACIGLIFDPNDSAMAQTFEKTVTPILEDIRSKRGLIDYRVVVDDSQEARDRLELNAKIYLKLMPNLEYININLVVTPSGVSFDDI